MDLDLVLKILDNATTVIGGAAVIATVTPTKKDDTVLSWLTQLIHLLAFNFGKAKPAKTKTEGLK